MTEWNPPVEFSHCLWVSSCFSSTRSKIDVLLKSGIRENCQFKILRWHLLLKYGIKVKSWHIWSFFKFNVEIVLRKLADPCPVAKLNSELEIPCSFWFRYAVQRSTDRTEVYNLRLTARHLRQLRRARIFNFFHAFVNSMPDASLKIPTWTFLNLWQQPPRVLPSLLGLFRMEICDGSVFRGTL